jgi:Pyruvate/2-oxoacid:ferredoxin oxidoreductase delta subunit
LNATEIAKEWTIDRIHDDLSKIRKLLERSYKRGIVNKCEHGCFKPSDFHARFEIWSMFEGWKDLPQEMREKLNKWELEYYGQQHLDQITTLKNIEYRDPTLRWPEYILLHEAEALIERVDHIYLWPCDCRSMMGSCKKTVYTCLRFSNSRNIGWEISKYRAKEIICGANKAGLMQSGEIAVSSDGSITGAICNCCADCCYPHQLADNQRVQKLWPLTRHIAKRKKWRCTACGLCSKRCPFGAFTLRAQKYSKKLNCLASKEQKPIILFNGDLCRGCGICYTSCPEKAIEMLRLDNVPSAWEYILPQNNKASIRYRKRP